MLVVFDLDGTLIDSAEDLAIAVNETRVHVGMERLDAKLIHSYVGNGAAVLVRRALGPEASEQLVDEALLLLHKVLPEACAGAHEALSRCGGDCE
jgi:phosphoglycolate phosphatase